MKTRFMAILMMTLALLIGAGAAMADDKQPLLLILTSGDTQTQGMALVLSNEAQRQGAEVRVLLCSEAGKLALREHEAPTLKPRDISPKQMLETLMQGGAKVDVCALFLPNLGKTQEDLLLGVSAAKPPIITELLLDKKVRLLNF
ncbi:DsrE family protein [Geoalkalibacter sp.]|uniref:DsrE family protein n=1 Tax=Geoalkalibacter sp. TaxID=3041440 RepID=UPI00272E3E89|nr:DsrE family protein [Geoalkalibacter sp.]